MTYSIPIRDEAGIRMRWWANFTKGVREEKFGKELNFMTSDWLIHRELVLETHNAVYDGTHVNFATEPDAMFFLLRWS